MALTFKKGPPSGSVRMSRNMVYLASSSWDDYSFKTTFSASLFDDSGNHFALGQVKIGYVGQPHGRTDEKLPDTFEALEPNFFSLGQGVDFYSRMATFPNDLKVQILTALRDVVFDEEALLAAKGQRVFDDSLLRTTNLSSITSQFRRVLNGGAPLTNFQFTYRSDASEVRAGFALSFDVVPDKKPSQNVHVLIGRNGIGKTTLLNGMIASLTEQAPQQNPIRGFFDDEIFGSPAISQGYFAGVVSVSFSAFDPFIPPPDSISNEVVPKYSYIGLKHSIVEGGIRVSKHKDSDALSTEFSSSLIGCFGHPSKRERWLRAIQFLASDPNFQDMDLGRWNEIEDQDTLSHVAKRNFAEKMSSGHAVVLLTITKLIERSEEKTLVILDEPESHLHPPLLSAFIRAISDLLNRINGVAIIATHSPVILQEVPKSCVWKLYRSKLNSEFIRPDVETFGENVGVLTRDVFNLEVESSGFYDLLTKSVAENKTYEQVLAEYDDQLGYEGRAILRALVSSRDKSASAS
jgi:predicted ATPase